MTALPNANSNSSPCRTFAPPCPVASKSVETAGNDDLPPPTRSTFPRLFATQVANTPERTAVVFEDQTWTYAELDNASNRLAAALLSSPCAQEERIGICLDRSGDAIIAMIGVLKAGLAFVPLDPDFPVDRLAYIVQDASIGRIVGDTKYAHLFGGVNDSLRFTSVSELLRSEAPFAASDIEIHSDQLAYIMYTSGSTGTPKGVQIEHGSLTTYCLADVEVYQLEPSDRTLQFSTLTFDIAIEEIFPPLLVGGSVVVRPRDRADAQNELSAIIERHGVTAIHLATAYWHEWVDLMVTSNTTVPKSLRLMVVTGEKVSAQHYARWQERCEHKVLWCNAYGPTEATVTATVFVPPCDWQGANLPIGKPLPGYEAWILDAHQSPIGIPVNDGGESETGELYIGGPALARGYLNLPEQTAESFVELELNDHPTRLYKTGDLARWSSSGDIEFGGRIDHQIKLGSYRIEPAEIEAAINQHANVLEALVSYDEIDGKKYLVAYVARGSNRLTPVELVDHLRNLLPPYMVPSRYLFLASFPKTVNGKIDRKQLPSPTASEVARRCDYRPAETELEKQLAEIWAGVLNVPSIGVHDDFFELGGSSLLVTRVIAQIGAQLEFEIPVRDFFANPTVACIARHLEAMQAPERTQPCSDAANALRRTLPKFETHFIASGSERLYTTYYPPVNVPPEATAPAVLICSPYGHEYQRAYRNLQQLALHLSRQGAHVLRFDYAGTGNSSGEDIDFRPASGARDIKAASDYLAARSSNASQTLVAMRLGGLVANAAGPLEKVNQVVLWDPVISGDNFVRLLDEFFEYTTRGFRRFQQRRRVARIPQGYGHAFPAALRSELSNSKIDADAFTFAKVSIVISANYHQCEPGWSAPSDWPTFMTNDELYWHDPRYAESAFSSPDGFQRVTELALTTREATSNLQTTSSDMMPAGAVR